MKKYIFYISQNYSFSILRPIQEILWQRGDDVRWFFEGQGVNRKYLKENEQTLDTIEKLIAFKPDAVLAPAQSIPSFLPGLKVSVNHGFHIGKKDRHGNNDHFKLRGCFDLFCTQGPDTTIPFQKMQKTYAFFNVIETGWQAIDALFMHKALPENSRPTILYCSTFSKRLTSTRDLLPYIKQLSSQSKWQWFIQFHPKMDNQVVRQYKSLENENLTFIETDDITDLLLQSDVMVCDTSSVIPMFLLLNKPVVSYRNIAPGPHLIDIQSAVDLEDSIKHALSYPQDLMQEIESYNQHIHPYRDGQSAERVINAIDDVLAGNHPVSPRSISIHIRNVLKNLKYRKRLSYWKFW